MTTLDTERAPLVARPVWSLLGGGGLALGAVLLLVATLLEYPLLLDGAERGPVFWGFVVAFSLSLVVYALAMLPLALGARGGDGIVAGSFAGKAALIGFGLSWLAAQTVYLLSHYFTAPGSDFAAANAASTALIALSYLSVLVAGVVIARARVATGIARWSLLAMLVVSGVAGAVANSTDSAELVTIAYLVSTLAQLVVGLSYLLSRPAPA